MSTTSITLAWSASRDNVGVSGYGVYVNGVRVASTTLRSYKPTSLTCGTTYKLGVDAYDAARNRSGIVSVLAATAPCLDGTAPTAPKDVHQSSWNHAGAGVEWSGATDNVGIAGYSIYRDGVPIATTQQSTAWVPNLVCGAGYSVSVEAFDAAGNHSPRTTAVVNTTSCADTTAPTAPGNLNVSGSTSSTISVAWQPSSDDRGVAEYRVSLESLNLRTTTGTTASFSGLACGRSYVVKVVAADAAGNVSGSASVSAPTSPCASGSADTQPPTMPTGLLRRDQTGTSVTLSWNASTDNVGVAGYGIYRAGTKVADANVTASEVQGLTCATSYTFAVDAVDVNGLRSARATLVAMTEPCPGTTAPSAPTTLAAQSRTETSIALSWQASTGASGYRVYRDGVLAGTTATTSYAVTGLTCGKSYTLGVEAYDAAGNHSTRPATILSTAACSDVLPPSPPTALIKASSTATSVSLSWTAASDNVGVAGYSLYVGSTAIGTTPQTSYTFSSLTCGTNYTLGVEAYDAAGNRSPRVTVSAATGACATAPAPPSPTGSFYVAPTGSDANPCTPAQPCLSFGRAYKAAKAGSTVLVAAGTYAGQEIDEDPTKLGGAPVSFEPAGGTVTVAGTVDFGQAQYDRRGPVGVTLRNMNITYLRSWPGSSGLRWENIRAKHFDIFDSVDVIVRGGDYGPCQAPRDDPSCVSRIDGDNIIVDGAVIHDVTSTDLVRYHVDGIFIRDGANITVRNTKFYGNMVTNIRVQNCCGGTISGLTLENNWFGGALEGNGTSIRGDGIDIDSPVPNLLVRFNSFAEGTGIQSTATQPGARFTGNLFTNFPCASGVTYSYNIFVPFSAYTGQTACGPTDKRVASLGYVSGAIGGNFDFRLAPGAAAADYVPTTVGCPTGDYEGTPRPQGGACDSGADER